MKVAYSFNSMDPSYKSGKNRNNLDSVKTTLPVTSMIDGKSYTLELTQLETMRTPLKYAQIKILDDMVDSTPTIRVGLDEITETLFAQPFNLTLVKNDITTNDVSKKKNKGARDKRKDAGTKSTIFGNADQSGAYKRGTEDGDAKNVESGDMEAENIKNLNNDIKLDEVTTKVMKDYWLPALRNIKTNVDKYGFSPLYFLEKSIPTVTYVKVSTGANGRPESSGKKRPRSESMDVVDDDFDDAPRSTKKYKRVTTEAINVDESTESPKKAADDYYESGMDYKEGNRLKAAPKVKERANGYNERDVLANGGRLVGEPMISRLGVSIPKNPDGSLSSTLIAREDTGITPGVPLPQTGGTTASVKYPSIPNTQIGTLSAEDVEKINNLEEKYLTKALTGTNHKTLEEYQRASKKIKNYNSNIKPVDVVYQRQNDDREYKSSSKTKQLKSESQNGSEADELPTEGRQSTRRGTTKMQSDAYRIVKRTTNVKHKIPVVPPFSLGSIETYWTMEEQKLVWTWKTQTRGGGTIEPNMLWVIDKMPTLDGSIKSPLSVLIKDYNSIKLNESRLKDIQISSMNPTYAIEKTEGKHSESTKSGLDGDFYTSLMNPNYAGPVLNNSAVDSGAFGDRPRGFMRADDPQGHNYWDNGTLLNVDDDGEVPLNVAMANYLNNRGPKPPNWLGSEDEDRIRNMMQTTSMKRDRPVASIFLKPVVENQYGTFIKLGFNEKISRIDKPLPYNTSDLEEAKKRLDISAGIVTGRPLGSLLTLAEKGSGGNVFTSKTADLSNAPQFGLGVSTTSQSPVADFMFSRISKLKQSYAEVIKMLFKLAYGDVYKSREGWYRDILERTFNSNPSVLNSVIGDPNQAVLPSFESLFSIKITMPSSGVVDMVKLIELWRFGLIDAEDFVLSIPDKYQGFDKPENHLQMKQHKSKDSRDNFDNLVKRVSKHLNEAKAFEIKKLKTNEPPTSSPTMGPKKDNTSTNDAKKPKDESKEVKKGNQTK